MLHDLSPNFSKDWDFKDYAPQSDNITEERDHSWVSYVVVDESYFDRKLSRGVPQFLTVTFFWGCLARNQYRMPFYENMPEDWKRHFDFKRLHDHLDK